MKRVGSCNVIGWGRKMGMLACLKYSKYPINMYLLDALVAFRISGESFKVL